MMTGLFEGDLNLKVLRGFMLSVLLGLGSVAQAGFEVMEEETHDFGNAQNQVFREAVENEAPMDSKDRNYLASVEEQRFGNRWYWRAMLGRPKANLKNITNQTTNIQGSPGQTSVKDDVFHFNLAWGYKWNRWATELELMISEAIPYKANPILTGQTIYLDSDVKNFGLFWNLEYEFPRYFEFIPTQLHPYMNLGIGLTSNTADSATFSAGGQGRQVQTKRSTDFAYNGGLGIKYQITGTIILDLAYRWYQLGGVKFGPIDDVKFTLSAKDLNTKGIYLGIVYQM